MNLAFGGGLATVGLYSIFFERFAYGTSARLTGLTRLALVVLLGLSLQNRNVTPDATDDRRLISSSLRMSSCSTLNPMADLTGTELYGVCFSGSGRVKVGVHRKASPP